MSYANMDHAGWVESHNTASRVLKQRSAAKFAGTTIGPFGAPEKLTPFQARVMDIVGIVGHGIYNTPVTWDKVDWNMGGGGIRVPLRHATFATFDFGELTRLVFLCHDARIRCHIEPNGMRGFALCFWQRSHEGGMSQRHPNLTEAIAEHRAYVSEDHHIAYRAPHEQAA